MANTSKNGEKLFPHFRCKLLIYMEAGVGIEPAYTALQAAA